MGTSNGSISCILVEVNETTPVVLREKLNFHSTEIGPVVEALKKEALFLESFFMCSCNRTLLMFVCETRKLGIAKRRARALFNVLAKTKIPSKGIHVHVDRKAFRRFLRVALGIESPIFAEDQILGQIRLFYRIALERRLTGKLLNRIIQKMQFSAKKIKNEIGLSKGKLSLSGLVIEEVEAFVRRIGKKNPRILIIGWGEITFAIHKGLARIVNPESITIANRTLEKINLHGPKMSIDEAKEAWCSFDAVISMTSRLGYVVSSGNFSEKDNASLLIDLGVPRNIDPALAKSPGVRLINIDNLNAVALKNLGRRRRAARGLSKKIAPFEKYALDQLERTDGVLVEHKMREIMLIIERAFTDANPSRDNVSDHAILRSISKKIHAIIRE